MVVGSVVSSNALWGQYIDAKRSHMVVGYGRFIFYETAYSRIEFPRTRRAFSIYSAFWKNILSNGQKAVVREIVF